MSHSHDPGVWQRARQCFFSALDVPAAQRQQFVLDQCSGDPELHSAVEALLAGHQESSELDSLVLTPAEGVIDELRNQVRTMVSDLEPGTVVGTFEVIEKLGEGGMATVYRARRSTEDFHQEVALKVLRRQIADQQAVARFGLERQIAASLDHPNIASLIDGGLTSDGLPYFAMEMVEGLPIDEYCDFHRLSIDRRVRLLVDVAAAVHHAHRNLLIHRDLKPTNILVEAGGRIRLLDFGIAKPLDPELGNIARTQTGALLLTPRYASPEQFTGAAITTASDQYQLGLLLFELVTGHCHHLLAGDDLSRVGQQIVELDTPRPSRLLSSSSQSRTTTATKNLSIAEIAAARDSTVVELGKRLRGDLDTILLKALDKNPEQRYSSVEAFLQDLQRFLADQPVVARPATVIYRAQKLFRRHRWSISAAVLGLFTIVFAAVTASWQAVRATRAEAVALTAANTAEHVSDFLVDLFSVADPENARGGDLTASEILDRGRHRVETDLADEPLVQARLLATIAEIHRKLGMYDDARDLAEASLEIRARELGNNDPRVALSLRALARVLADSGNDADAAPYFRRAQELLAAAEQPIERASTLLDIGHLEQRSANLDEAEQMFQLAEQLFEEAGATDLQLAAALEGRGGVRFARSDLETAESLQRAVLEIREQALDEQHPDLARALSALANTLGWQGRDAESAPLHRRAVEILERVYGSEHRLVSEGLSRLGSLYGRMGELEAAEAAFRRADEIKTSVFGAEHPQTIGGTLNLGRIHHLQGEFGDAEAHYSRASRAAKSGLGDAHPLYGFANSELGNLYRDLDQYQLAKEHYQLGLAVLEGAFGPEHARIAESIAGLAFIEAETGSLEQAKQLYERALAIQTAAFDGDQPPLANTLNGLGLVARRSGDFDTAKQLHQRAHDAWANAYSPQHPAAGKALGLRGRAELEAGELEAAKQSFEAALAISDQNHGSGHIESIEPLKGLAEVAVANRNLERALELIESAVSILEKSHGSAEPEHPDLATAIDTRNRLRERLRSGQTSSTR